MNEMTDKQMEVILNLVADKFAGCKDMEEVKRAIDEVRNMAKKEKPEGQALGNEKGGGLAEAAPINNIITSWEKNINIDESCYRMLH